MDNEFIWVFGIQTPFSEVGGGSVTTLPPWSPIGLVIHIQNIPYTRYNSSFWKELIHGCHVQSIYLYTAITGILANFILIDSLVSSLSAIFGNGRLYKSLKRYI